MGIRPFSKARLLRAICGLIVLAAASGAHAQSLTVTAANASNDSIYDVTFNNNGGGSINVLNSDGSRLHQLQALTFANNSATQQLDLLVADNQGLIVRYFGNFVPPAQTTGTLVWSFAANGGPSSPEGIAVDAFGNVFVVNTASGTSTQAQVWELVFDPTGHTFQTANRIDDSSSPFSAKTTLAETMVASSSIVLACSSPCASFTINPGDLLVLKSDPAGSAVLDYAGQGGQGPSGITTPTTLIALPTGVQPGGMAFWQTSSGTNLLVATGSGQILQYSLATNPATLLGNFNAVSLGNGQFKLKTGTQFGVPYVFVADVNNGRIIQFNADGTQRAVVTAGVQHPQGLAVTNAGYQALANCGVQSNGTQGTCDVLGGNVLTHSVKNNSLPGNILEDVCVVLNDPRATGPGTCQNVDLDVSTVCGAAFAASADTPSHIKISAAHCGASGPTGKGFAMVRSDTVADSGTLNGQLVESTANALNILPGANSPACQSAPNVIPQAVALWASKSGEGGTPAEGPYMMDATNGCSAGHIASGGGSVWALGLELNQNTGGLPGGSIAGLGGVVDTEYGDVFGTINLEVADGHLTAPTCPPPGRGSCTTFTPPNFNFTFKLQQCMQTSQNAFDKGSSNYPGAAADLLTADQNIRSNPAAFTGPTPAEPNASGALEQRVEHLFYEVETRLGGVNYGHVPPLPPAAPYLPTPPSFVGTPPTSFKVNLGSFFSFTPTATDFAGNSATLTYSVTGLPSWAQFDPYSGTVFGTATVKGSSSIQITVTDGCAPGNKPLTYTIKVIG